MTTRPFPMTPQLEAYVAGEIAKAVNDERIQGQRDLRRVQRELGQAKRDAADAVAARDRAVAEKNHALGVVADLADLTTRRDWLGRKARRRLTRIHSFVTSQNGPRA